MTTLGEEPEEQTRHHPGFAPTQSSHGPRPSIHGVSMVTESVERHQFDEPGTAREQDTSR
jgi:hypothetical protein